jgi:hypothetical protein
LSQQQLSDLAIRLYTYFEYFDEFQSWQTVKTDKLHGKRYRRIRYGSEKWLDKNGEPYKDESGKAFDMEQVWSHPCHDCGAIRGQFHCDGCDVEQCPRCKGQALGCGCRLQKDYD